MNENNLLHSHVKHLLSQDDCKSEIICKKEIEGKLKEKLKEKLKKNAIGRAGELPQNIDVSIKNGVLRFYVEDTLKNMQENCAAFEGWIIVLKTWLSDDIKYVELDFTVPSGVSEEPEERCGIEQALNYNRFLYRLSNMLRLFPKWFFVHESKQRIVTKFMHFLESNTCVLNHPIKDREPVIESRYLERVIESWFVFHEGKNLLCNRWGIDRDKLYNQLPIGAFNKEIIETTAIFPRNASAIDIWGISQDGKDLHLIELKRGENKDIGVISQVLFYSAVLYDTKISDKPLFKLGRRPKSKETKCMLAFNNDEQQFGRLFAHVLAEEFHSLFNEEVEASIAEGLSSLHIGFDRALYDGSKKILLS